jgi:hypothetical protein
MQKLGIFSPHPILFRSIAAAKFHTFNRRPCPFGSKDSVIMSQRVKALAVIMPSEVQIILFHRSNKIAKILENTLIRFTNLADV